MQPNRKYGRFAEHRQQDQTHTLRSLFSAPFSNFSMISFACESTVCQCLIGVFLTCTRLTSSTVLGSGIPSPTVCFLPVWSSLPVSSWMPSTPPSVTDRTGERRQTYLRALEFHRLLSRPCDIITSYPLLSQRDLGFVECYSAL